MIMVCNHLRDYIKTYTGLKLCNASNKFCPLALDIVTCTNEEILKYIWNVLFMPCYHLKFKS